MYLPRKIRGSDDELLPFDPVDDPMPAGAGFLLVVCGSLAFWLFVLILLSAF